MPIPVRQQRWNADRCNYCERFATLGFFLTYEIEDRRPPFALACRDHHADAEADVRTARKREAAHATTDNGAH